MKIISADLILPITHPPLKNYALFIKEGKIFQIGPRSQLKKKYPHLPEFHYPLVMPGLINAHTHLELSGFKKISAQGGFASWLIRLIREKRKWSSEKLAQSAREEIQNQLQLGITSLGDVLNDPILLQVHHQSPLFSTAFYELIGIREEDIPLKMELAKKHLTEFNFKLGRAGVGLSPHSPYTANLSLYRQAKIFAQKNQLHLCTHLAESQDEVEFVRTGTGHLIERLYSQELKMSIKVQPVNCSPVEYLSEFIDENMTFIHCIEVSDSDLEIIAKARAVVHCPRSNLYLTGKIATVPKMLKAGIAVALGTDSPASAGDGNLWEEMKKVYELRKEYPGGEIPIWEILKMATINGARAIFREKEIGSLELGKLANLLCLNFKPLPDKAESLAETIISIGSSALSSVFLAGEPVCES